MYPLSLWIQMVVDVSSNFGLTVLYNSDPPPPPFFTLFLKGGGQVNFYYLPRRGRIRNIFKKNGAEASLLKMREGVGVTFLHLEITLLFAKLCFAFEEKLRFSATTIL